ncbi:uncharacterized protein CTRU02_204287 [Colletotrichum truncatum]|uniref:Uncharacterized protein n=1 Tax=Colletotrichum truncatum TaxID=5467 RepID=A0ACC3ZBQ8_COLTU|nr:uncharacterized protein CTRU02_10139 [Colletotrichum truncatum]KAF6787844.1 hypothetical protein CTRU02_10139 [Colletotrichum truncatum]
MTSNRSILKSLSLALYLSAQLAQAQECSYEGGWALRNDRSCPPSAPVECGTGAQPRCCPSGFTCTGDGDYVGNYCCSDPKDCRALALSHPKCPDSSWTLWGVDGKLDNGGWCCTSGSNGTYRENSQGIALLCTPSTATSLPQSHHWAEPVSTSSCSTTTTAASSAATTTSAEATSATAAGTETTSQPDPTNTAAPADKESNGLSSGGIAGAAIGGVAGVALIIAGIFLMRRRKKSAAETTTATTEEGGWASRDKKNNFGGYYNPAANEMPAQAARVELADTAQPTYELDGSTPHELESIPTNTPRTK